jgi:uncharacterized protein (DUF362 family)
MKNLRQCLGPKDVPARTCNVLRILRHSTTLNVLDAYLVMKHNGPRGVSVDDVVLMKSQLLSTDMVTLDVAGSKLFGVDPNDVRYITLAIAKGVGRPNLEALNIKRITL